MTLLPVTVKCSRCYCHVDGYELDNGVTAGFVRLSSRRWVKYARPGETELCDLCLLRDPAYRRDYPHVGDQLRMNGL